MSEYEKQQIAYEAARNEAMDNFYEARSQLIRDRDAEFLFESGFRMAWNTRTSGWQPIETAPKHEFDKDNWWRNGPYYLLWIGHVTVGSYSYTKTGKGRWQNHLGNIAPTHWMPLPEPPNEQSHD